RFDQAEYCMDHGRFAGAGLADDRKQPRYRHLQIDPIEHNALTEPDLKVAHGKGRGFIDFQWLTNWLTNSMLSLCFALRSCLNFIDGLNRMHVTVEIMQLCLESGHTREQPSEQSYHNNNVCRRHPQSSASQDKYRSEADQAEIFDDNTPQFRPNLIHPLH